MLSYINLNLSGDVIVGCPNRTLPVDTGKKEPSIIHSKDFKGIIANNKNIDILLENQSRECKIHSYIDLNNKINHSKNICNKNLYLVGISTNFSYYNIDKLTEASFKPSKEITENR